MAALLRESEEERKTENGEQKLQTENGGEVEVTAALLEAVESSLVEYLVDLFPNLPMDIVLYNVRFAQLTKKSQEYVVDQCLQFSSMDPNEQELQLQHFREQTLFLVNGDAGNRNSNDGGEGSGNVINQRVRSNSNRILQQPSFEDDIETNGGKKNKNKKRKKEEKVAQDVFDLVNEFRVKCEQAPLQWDPRLSRAALVHSKNMAKKKIPAGHTGFQERARSLPLECYQVGENVAVIRGYTDVAKSAYVGWYHSNGHRMTMLDCYEYCGVGVWKSFSLFGSVWYITQIFARTSPLIDDSQSLSV